MVPTLEESHFLSHTQKINKGKKILLLVVVGRCELEFVVVVNGSSGLLLAFPAVFQGLLPSGGPCTKQQGDLQKVKRYLFYTTSQTHPMN